MLVADGLRLPDALLVFVQPWMASKLGGLIG